jgi:hypothetical protein
MGSEAPADEELQQAQGALALDPSVWQAMTLPEAGEDGDSDMVRAGIGSDALIWASLPALPGKLPRLHIARAKLAAWCHNNMPVWCHNNMPAIIAELLELRAYRREMMDRP